jgi:hypothetical protein
MGCVLGSTKFSGSAAEPGVPYCALRGLCKVWQCQLALTAHHNEHNLLKGLMGFYSGHLLCGGLRSVWLDDQMGKL